MEAPAFHFRPSRTENLRARCRVQFQVLSLSRPGTERPASLRPNPGRRGRVVSFSRRSRKRLLRLLAEVRQDLLPEPFFVTLTFHRRPADPYRCFQALRMYLHRHGIRAVWRLELQKRGVEHWHMIVWGDPERVQGIREAWHRIASEGSFRHAEYGCRIDPIKGGWKQLVAYVSKYMGKESDLEEDTALIGHRRWGKIGRIPRDPFEERGLSDDEYRLLRRIVRRLKRARARRQGRKLSGKTERLAGFYGDYVFLHWGEGLKLIFFVCEGRGRPESFLGGIRGSPPVWPAGAGQDGPRIRYSDPGLAGVSCA